jgi:hypothetical protein
MKLKALALILLCSAIVPTQVLGEILDEDLEGIYMWGSMYLTNDNLSDMRKVLNSAENYEKIFEKFPVVSALKKFLDSHKRLRLEEGLAFLQIDLQEMKAGYKKADDPDGNIHKQSWSASEVQQIAQFCHKFLNENQTLAGLRTSIRAGEIGVKECWLKLSSHFDNPYIAHSRILRSSEDFRLLIQKKPDEFKALQNEDPKLYAELHNFAGLYDSLPVIQRMNGIRYEQDIRLAEFKLRDQIRIEDSENWESLVFLYEKAFRQALKDRFSPRETE